jgi:two-component system, cell cycle sensor histidine kinase and response regulator CckA
MNRRLYSFPPKMNLNLRVLIVEDSEDDMLLIQRELRRGGYAVDSVRVDTPTAMQAALEKQQWDLVLADYSLPAFSAPQALQLLQSQKLDLPFIIVSGTIGEDTAVAAMKAGAHDYLIKGNLTRLVPAVERELREAEDRQKRQSAEQALQESEARYRLLFECNPNPMWVFDLETSAFLAVNQAAIAHYGYSKADFLSMTIADIRPPEDMSTLHQTQNTPTSQQNYTEIWKHIKKDGSLIDVEILTHTFTFADKPASLILVNDITEKKQLEAQFLRAQRLESLGTLASGIAHDFNNILTPILAAAQLLPLKLPDLNEQDRVLLKLIEDSTKRGADLVKQILAFARGAEGKRLPLQVRHLLSEVVQVARQTFPKNIDIETNIPATDLWTVSADATQLHQVLMNLCVNARDAMPGGGTLCLSVKNHLVDAAFARMNLEAHTGSYVMITVSDTGMGIPTKLMDRIFDPFFTTKDHGKGTGLGLSTVLGIVKNHGGFIKVYSEVEQGTQFKVYLPAIADAVIPPSQELALLTGHQELILIVDDEPFIQQVAQTALEAHNYRTIVADNGLEAISLYAKHFHEISAVLMDIMMPSMDGLAAISTLQTLNPQVRVIASSGLSSNSQLAEEAGIGFNIFLAKPYTAKELLGALQQVLTMDNF